MLYYNKSRILTAWPYTASRGRHPLINMITKGWEKRKRSSKWLYSLDSTCINKSYNQFCVLYLSKITYWDPSHLHRPMLRNRMLSFGRVDLQWTFTIPIYSHRSTHQGKTTWPSTLGSVRWGGARSHNPPILGYTLLWHQIVSEGIQ